MVNNVATFEKAENIEYNADGHIVTYGDNTYVYDGLGRLIRENNKALDKTFIFEYNVGGNIMYRSEFPYTTGTPSALIKIYDYSYNNAWKDQLTSYDYTPITYDASGNPISYLGATLTWSRGRLLTKYVNGDTTVNIQYDARGFRRSSTKVKGTTTSNREFIYSDDGRLLYDKVNTFERYYLYGQDGIVGFEEDGVIYTFRKNFFGDVTAIYQGTTKVAEYVYDAWGNCTITTNVNGYGTRNPIRYRGYYFDNDLQMYYLMTRYYDPQTGRFINADTPEYLKPSKINGLNLYAYCNNNPVMNVDPSGHEVLSVATTWLLCQIAMILIAGGIFFAFVDWIYSLDLDNKEKESQPQVSSGDAEVIAAAAEGLPEMVANWFENTSSFKGSTQKYGALSGGGGGDWFENTSSFKGSTKKYGAFSGGGGGGFGGGFGGGDSLWDPVLQAILNESFTGSFD